MESLTLTAQTCRALVADWWSTGRSADRFLALCAHPGFSALDTLTRCWIQFTLSAIRASQGDAEGAWSLLVELERAGFCDPLALESAEFAVFKGDARFESLMSRMVDRNGYLEQLRAGGRYGSDPASISERFSYEAAQLPELVRLREELGLVAIAGTGSDEERVFRVMRWLHANARHQGARAMDFPRHTFEILARGREGGVNCRCLAICLSELLLSLGFRARHITCLPRSPADHDCHVVNTVFLPFLGKWVFLDPTLDAHFRDEGGSLLGLAELRAAFVSGKPIHLNEDANWNGERVEDVSSVLRYYAKNFFMFHCPLRFGFWTEKPGADVASVLLAPLGWEPPPSQRHGSLRILTHDDDFFWERC